MPCYSPLRAFQCTNGDIVFTELARYDITKQLQLPCGQCIGCRLERSRQWAMRCVHEASLYKANAFITLTYEDAQLPKYGNLNYPDFQKFLKRLRKHTGPTRVRFYMCGEYGEQTQRPHYHAALFNYDFEDKYYWKTSNTGELLYRSATLEQLWPHGQSLTGDVTFESAAYIARYCTTKITGKEAKAHYTRTAPDGTIYKLTPEFNKMSLKPGVGAHWFELWKTDVYPHDYVIINGKEVKPPKYYDKLLKRQAPDQYEDIKINRELDALDNCDDNTPERLAVKEIVAKARKRLLVRNEI